MNVIAALVAGANGVMFIRLLLELVEHGKVRGDGHDLFPLPQLMLCLAWLFFGGVFAVQAALA